MTNKDLEQQTEDSQEPATPVESTTDVDLTEEEAAMDTLQTDFEKFRDLALRSQADLDNYRKRAAREKADAIKFANASLLESLLPILDNFQLGLEAARSDSADGAVLQGLGMVLKQIESFLKDNNVTVIEAAGLEFDPNLHEALAHVPSDTVEEGKVVDLVGTGYMLKDRLLRAAKVTVSKGPAA